jgi:hypothetical protein
MIFSIPRNFDCLGKLDFFNTVAFHEKGGRSQVDLFWSLLITLLFPSHSASVATVPSALFDERLLRSVRLAKKACIICPRVPC